MKVGLFIPCYINAIYPQVGVASYKILSRLGVDVDYPLDQTCCGQPMANAGFENEASRLARRFETLFQSYDYIVGQLCGFRQTKPSRHIGTRRTSVRECGENI